MIFTYAQNAELFAVLQNLIPVKTFEDPIFTDIMPVRSTKAQRVIWDQRDDYKGLTGARGYGGPFGQVKREGIKRYGVDPVPFGEDKLMSEDWFLNTRQEGTFGDAIDLTQGQMEDQVHLLDRAINRLRKVGWDLVTTGTYSVLGPNGQVIGTDSYTLKSYTAAVSWANFASSTPLLDLRNIKLLHRGQSVSFNKRAKIYMQSVDVNNLLSNTNPNDLGAKRVITQNAGAQPMSLADVNNYLLDNDLPQIVEYDKFYLDETGTYQMFIPQGTMVVVGARDEGDPVAEFMMTPNFGQLASGSKIGNKGFENIYVDFKLDMDQFNARSRIAFNGAPAVYFPSAIVKAVIAY